MIVYETDKYIVEMTADDSSPENHSVRTFYVIRKSDQEVEGEHRYRDFAIKQVDLLDPPSNA